MPFRYFQHFDHIKTRILKANSLSIINELILRVHSKLAQVHFWRMQRFVSLFTREVKLPLLKGTSYTVVVEVGRSVCPRECTAINLISRAFN